MIEDFNGDGLPDIFIVCHGYDTEPYPGEPNVLLLSTPDGYLADASSNIPDYNDFSHSVAVGDIDNDGDIDIYVGNLSGQENIMPYLLLNDGNGKFEENSANLPQLEDLSYYSASAFVDINNDGSVDLILGSCTTVSSKIFYNDGSGHFKDSQKLVLPEGPFGNDKTINADILPFDLNNDGRMDLILSQTNSDPSYVGRSIQVLIQMEDGSFVDESDLRIKGGYAYDPDGKWMLFLAPVDFNKDGFLDILCQGIWSEFSDVPFVLLNDGTGYFDVLTHQVFNGIESYTFSRAVAIPKKEGKIVNFLSTWFQDSNLLWSTYESIERDGSGGGGGGGG